ncbi:MAG: Gfo/Idh/MocA family oxidoreductase [Planctomycetia bacterium]|nr:Gfo/Idh/MocA family oxidoreductase [Planctomycetia bacterium]
MLRVGITGIGFMGWIHYLAYKQIPDVEVVAFCEKIPERLAGDWTQIKGNFGPQGEKIDMTPYATYSELSDLIADANVDMVDICLPPNQHAAAAIACLEGGKDVFCEKPISLNAEDGAAMVAAAEKSGKLLNIGHVLPFFPAYQVLYEAKMDGRWGKLLGGNFTRVTSIPTWLPNYWKMDIVGGPMLDLHVHDAHFIRCLFGMPKGVQSVGRCRDGVPEYFNTQFFFDDPQLCVTATSGVIRQQGRPFTAGFEVHFEKATLLTECFMGMPLTILHEDGSVEKPELPNTGDVGPFVAELTEATTAVRERRKSPLLAGDMASDALRICYMEMESLAR